jgi:hypothetical protein
VASDDGQSHKEKKIELPDSWVMGFLQVHSTMELSMTHITLAPIDLFNICRYLRRRKAKVSPRSLRFELTPGQTVTAVLEPWEHKIELAGPGIYEGKEEIIRTWGRDRLQVLARLIPVCRKVDLYLSGKGMPTIYVCDLGPITFTLALSGWTDNDWTGETRFGLLTRRLEVTTDELTQSYHAMRKLRLATDSELAKETGLGRAMFDLGGGVYRHRDLFMEPFSAKKAAQYAEQASEEHDPRAKEARSIFESNNVRIIARRPVSTGFKLSGSAAGVDGRRVRPLIHVDSDSHIIEASCTCPFARKNKLTKGPCEHILALRLAHMSRLESEDRINPS